MTRRSGLRRRFAVFLFALLISATGACADTPSSVLFVGNSFSYYNNGINNHYGGLAAAAGSSGG